jgi:hypothetical protein
MRYTLFTYSTEGAMGVKSTIVICQPGGAGGGGR